jgi:hypothetical protein
MDKPKCRLCGERHFSYEEHKFTNPFKPSSIQLAAPEHVRRTKHANAKPKRKTRKR